MAIAACLYYPACKGRKVATSQLSGGVVGGKKCHETSETGKRLAGYRERDSGSKRLWSAREVAPFFILKPRHDWLCYAAHPAATQTIQSRTGLSVPGLFGLVARQQEEILLWPFLYGSLMHWIRNRAATEMAARLCLWDLVGLTVMSVYISPAECACDNGICNDGLQGDGSCECFPGWKGPTCQESEWVWRGLWCNTAFLAEKSVLAEWGDHSCMCFASPRKLIKLC